MKMLLILILVLAYFRYAIYALREADRRKFLKYKEMYPEKTDQEIIDLMKGKFSQTKNEYYWDHEGW